MAAQVQQSTVATRLGGRIAKAHMETRNNPVDLGGMGLPAGIRAGVAKLTSAKITAFTAEAAAKDPWKKGEEFFRAAGTVVSPHAHEGVQVEGRFTSVMFNLCDVPAKGKRKFKSFEENWAEFQNWFQQFGVDPCPIVIDQQKDSDAVKAQKGAQIMAYYQSAAAGLVAKSQADKSAGYFNFSTRGWTPDAVPGQPKPTEMVFESWHGSTEWAPTAGGALSNGVVDHTAPPAEMAPGEPFTEPPQASDVPPSVDEPQPADSAGVADPADIIAALVTMAMEDPDGKTPDGKTAILQLQDHAYAAGITKEQINASDNWEEVGGWIITGDRPATAPIGVPEPIAAIPVVGAKAKFRKRDGKGQPLLKADKTQFDPLDIEVASVDESARALTAKTVKDGKLVVDLKKQSVQIKWEWLE